MQLKASAWKPLDPFIPAHSEETLFVPHESTYGDRPGMHSRRYATRNRLGGRGSFVSWTDRRKDGLNPNKKQRPHALSKLELRETFHTRLCSDQRF